MISVALTLYYGQKILYKKTTGRSSNKNSQLNFLTMRKNSLLRNNWKDYLNFSTRLRRGIYTLFLVILLEIAFLLYMHYSPSSEKPVDASKFQKEINAF